MRSQLSKKSRFDIDVPTLRRAICMDFKTFSKRYPGYESEYINYSENALDYPYLLKEENEAIYLTLGWAAKNAYFSVSLQRRHMHEFKHDWNHVHSLSGFVAFDPFSPGPGRYYIRPITSNDPRDKFGVSCVIYMYAPDSMDVNLKQFDFGLPFSKEFYHDMKNNRYVKVHSIEVFWMYIYKGFDLVFDQDVDSIREQVPVQMRPVFDYGYDIAPDEKIIVQPNIRRGRKKRDDEDE